jgi:hypothetical protein
MYPMVLLGDKAQVEARFVPFEDRANLDARLVHSLCRAYHRLRNHFGRTWWNSLVTWVMVNLVLVHLEMVLVSVQDRCTVCAKRTIGLEIILEEADGTPRWCGSCGISFRSVPWWCLCWSKIGARFAPNVPLGQKSFWTHLMVLQVDGAQVEARFGPFGESANLDVR